MLFLGQADVTIDAKQRLAVPSKFRPRTDAKNTTDSGKETHAWICVPYPGGVLRLYPEPRFEQLAHAAPSSLTPDREEAELEAALFGSAERLEPDSAGRITIPKPHLEMTGLSQEVTVVGARDRLEIRDRGAWRAAADDRFNKLPELVARTRARSSPGSSS